MKNLTTPKAIVYGLGLIALAIATTPFTSELIKPAHAVQGLTKVQICGKALDFKGSDFTNNIMKYTIQCAGIERGIFGTDDGSLNTNK
tara:strand:+ start:51 stop:314 length:264 start_codon:yes stop_codon:yes gene_type:complete